MARRPHIIMLLDESSFDVTSASGIKVPAGYTDYFKSSDGKQRTMIAEVRPAGRPGTPNITC